MRILHVIGWLAPRYGGPAVALPELCTALAARGHDVEIVTTNVDGDDRLPVPLGRRIPWAGSVATFHTVSRPTRYLTSWSMLADLRRRVASFNVVHIHSLYRFHGVAAAVVARRHDVPYVLQAHGALDPWHRSRRRHAKDLYHSFVEDPIIRGASALVCTSDREVQAIRSLGYSVPLSLVPMGIDAAALRLPAGADAFPSSRVAVGDRVVTFLGRISAKKGVPLLLDAFAATFERFPTAHLIVAGPDDEGIGRGLAEVIAARGLDARVSFVGPVAGEAKRALLQRSDVFVLPSADESFGIAVAEAMAVGCPVVVSPEVAVEDVVRGAGAGIVADRDPSAIAEAVAAILNEPARAAEMGEAGRRAVDEHFAWPIVAAKAEATYDSVVAAGKRRAARYADQGP